MFFFLSKNYCCYRCLYCLFCLDSGKCFCIDIFACVSIVHMNVVLTVIFCSSFIWYHCSLCINNTPLFSSNQLYDRVRDWLGGKKSGLRCAIEMRTIVTWWLTWLGWLYSYLVLLNCKKYLWNIAPVIWYFARAWKWCDRSIKLNWNDKKNSDRLIKIEKGNCNIYHVDVLVIYYVAIREFAAHDEMRTTIIFQIFFKSFSVKWKSLRNSCRIPFHFVHSNALLPGNSFAYERQIWYHLIENEYFDGDERASKILQLRAQHAFS